MRLLFCSSVFAPLPVVRCRGPGLREVILGANMRRSVGKAELTGEMDVNLSGVIH